jgi:hypothetical protein
MAEDNHVLLSAGSKNPLAKDIKFDKIVKSSIDDVNKDMDDLLKDFIND